MPIFVKINTEPELAAGTRCVPGSPFHGMPAGHAVELSPKVPTVPQFTSESVKAAIKALQAKKA